MKRVFRLPLLASLLCLLPACVPLAEVDSTSDPIFSTMLGQEYELREDLLVFGIKRDVRSVTPDYLLMMPPPGIGGRFVVDLGRLPRGIRFRIVGVVTHRSKLFPSTRYVIALHDRSIPGAADREIRISDLARCHVYLKPTAPGEPPPLNPHFFQALPLRSSSPTSEKCHSLNDTSSCALAQLP